MNNYTVYMHISPSGKRYIGITSTSVNQRWNNGKGYETQIFYRAIEKYGWDNIEHIIIAKGLDEETAKWLEIELIRELDTTNPSKGYNVTLGGEGTNGYKHTEETLKKMSGENNPTSIKVICITTNEVFGSLLEGARKYNIKSPTKITNCCRGYKIEKGKKVNINSCGKHPITGKKLVWKYLDDYLKEQQEQEQNLSDVLNDYFDELIS